MKNANWYERSFRRNLVDMHIEDWDPAFLSEFDPYAYFENLKKARIQSAMIYFHSHVGYSYYPTKTGKMHSALKGREDAVRVLTQLCRNAGIHVIGYYSLIFNTFEEDRHPEWRIIDSPDGTSSRQRESRYGRCCPNNPEYRDYVKAQIKEIGEYFTVDGMFYDMTFFPKICLCPHCQMRFWKETGISGIPSEQDWHEGSQWRRLVEKRQEWIGEFARFVTDASKEFMPHASVEHNYAHGVAGNWKEASTERVSDACDYVGGDIYKDRYWHSFAAKYYRSVSKNQPFEYMLSRCEQGLTWHTGIKSEEKMAAELFRTAAHHGATLVIDAMDPVGTLDERVYERIGRVFEKQIPYEPYFSGTPVEDAAVYYSPEGRFNPHEEKSDSVQGAIAALKALMKKNVPVGVVSNRSSDRLGAYRMIFAPAVGGLSEKCRRDVCDYVRQGGVFYFSGDAEPKLMKELLGASFSRFTPARFNYLAPTEAGGGLLEEFTPKYPMPVRNTLPLLDSRRPETRVLATLAPCCFDPENPRHFASIHSNPPAPPTDDPVILEADYGKGKVLWCAAPFEADESEHTVALLQRILRRYLPEEEQSVISDAPQQAEICTYAKEDGYQVETVDLLYSEERLPVVPFEVSVKLAEGELPRRVSRLPGGEEMEFQWENGRVSFRVPSLVLYDMIEIKTQRA